jgi:hypothetical protein
MPRLSPRARTQEFRWNRYSIPLEFLGNAMIEPFWPVLSGGGGVGKGRARTVFHWRRWRIQTPPDPSGEQIYMRRIDTMGTNEYGCAI